MATTCLIAAAVVALLAVAGFVIARGRADGPMPQAGQMAPNFTLPDQDDQSVRLDQYRGKWVVLYFYPKDMTSGCRIEAHGFERDLGKYQALHAVVLGVSVDTVKSHRKFCTKDSLTFTLLADPDRRMVLEYGSLGKFLGWTIARRNTFLIDPEGRIAQVWTRVNPKAHSEQVLEAIREGEQQRTRG